MLRISSLIVLLFFYTFSFSQRPLYKEKYRPQFHFTPPLHWMNDPNGLVYYKGEYHLFYQYNPMGIRWGHMSWGHAISKDLIHWRHLPVAIPEIKDTMIFSGSCVIDKNNTSGFAEEPGRVPMVAIYTGYVQGKGQSQFLSYSIDDGISWKNYNKNPVLDLQSEDFRDPQVFWYEPEKKWVMSVVLAVDKKIQLYSSDNLKQWSLMSSFGPAGDTSGVWECPDLFQVPIQGEPGKTKWVLMHSPAPYMQYFVGEFDGTSFKNENPVEKIYRPDYGADYYAAVVYKNLDAGSPPVSIGWINNWNYAQNIPTMPWRSMMSLPRSLSIKKINNEWILIQEPVTNIQLLRSAAVVQMKNVLFEKIKKLPVKSQQFEMDITIVPSAETVFEIKLAAGDNKEMVIGYNTATQMLYSDRSKTSNNNFDSAYIKLSRFETTLAPGNKELRLHIFFDKSIVEVFANNGEAAMSMQLFPDEKDNNVVLEIKNGNCLIKNLLVWPLKSSW